MRINLASVRIACYARRNRHGWSVVLRVSHEGGTYEITEPMPGGFVNRADAIAFAQQRRKDLLAENGFTEGT